MWKCAGESCSRVNISLLAESIVWCMINLETKLVCLSVCPLQPYVLLCACVSSVSVGVCMSVRVYACVSQHVGRGCSSVGRASNRHAAEAGSIPRGGKRFFSQSQLSMQSLLRCPYTPRVQLRALTSRRTLKIPSICSHTFVWTHENTIRTVRNG